MVLLAVAAAVTLAVVLAALTATRRNESASPADPIRSDLGAGVNTSVPSSSSAAPTGATTTTQYLFPETYVGPVWMTVTPSGPGPHEVVIQWGSWARTVEVKADGPSSYLFKKSWDPSGAASPAVSAGGDANVTVTFGYGAAPAGAEDVNEGWVAVDPSPASS